jgi:hypothetical protein
MAEGKRRLEIVQPCPAAWEAMQGTAERRHCGHCDKAVHDLSAMDPDAAAQLLERRDPICVRVRCSADGTVLHGARPEKSAGRARLQLLVTPTLLAAMAACQTGDAELPLVMEGPPASASPARVVLPAPVPPAEKTQRVASAERAANLEPQPRMHGSFLTGVTVAFNDKSGPLAPSPVHPKPRKAKAVRAEARKAHGTQKHPEHPPPDWLLERDRQPPPGRDGEFECQGFCL